MERHTSTEGLCCFDDDIFAYFVYPRIGNCARDGAS